MSADQASSSNSQIYLPGSSLYPLGTALGATTVLVGFITLWPVSIIGAVGLLVTVPRWIKQTRAETGRLPVH